MFGTVDSHREEEEEEDIMPLQERDLESASALLSPTHRIAPSTTLPPEGLSTLLVMTMLQTALLSLRALPEPRYNSAPQKSMTQASALGREMGFFWGGEEIDSVWSLEAPRHTPSLLSLRHPAEGRC